MDMVSTRRRACLLMATMVLVFLTLFAASASCGDVTRLAAEVKIERPSQATESVVRASYVPDAAVLAVLATGTIGLWLLRRLRRRREA
ncbi:MAG: hypothetical protein GVY16_06755 [Planctomycetes bacterium]|nr:hypothetical protein [Planctomycetota bacterium]